MLSLKSERSGHIKRMPTGYDAFIPNKLPPKPEIVISPYMQQLLSDADRKLGRLDGITQILPNPELFVAMYVKKEALLSAQIEGTQASLADVLNEPKDSSGKDYSPDGVKEVVNYVNALTWGLSRLQSLPLSLRLIREIHERLLSNVRGATKNPGEFRQSQNWIGPAGCTLKDAIFVPPDVESMHLCLYDLEKYFYDDGYIPALIKIALIHAQFETIHPFLDGNGRMGRLLITFWLCHQNILSQPLLYLSYYFKEHRDEYYQKLMDVRINGDWESWIVFFLSGVASVADEAISSAKSIISLQQKYDMLLSNIDKNSGYYHALLTQLFVNPIVSKPEVASILSTSPNTAGRVVDEFCRLGILRDITPNKTRYKRYMFYEYFDIVSRGT